MASTDSEDLLLSWFAGLGLPLVERQMNMGGLAYFHFSTEFFASDGRIVSTHGQSTERKAAALKCVAEYIERVTLVDFFLNHRDGLFAPPPGLKNSNGWAVHFHLEKARERSFLEALERHLLLKSFIEFGWDGLPMANRVEGDQLTLTFLASRYRYKGIGAGLVAAKSPKYPGVSIGYCAGPEDKMGTSDFWMPAIFESVGKLQALDGRKINLAADPDSWMLTESKQYLEEPFDEGLFSSKFAGQWIEDEIHGFNTYEFDLKNQFSLPCDFFAAYTCGGNLIPLFCTRVLPDASLAWLQMVFARNNIHKQPPLRHPIL